MLLKIREYPGCTIVDMPERIVKGPESASFRRDLEALGEKERNLGLNFSKTGYIDSGLVSILLTLDRRIRQTGKKLFIIRPSESILEILTITSIARIVPILDSEDPLTDRHD